MSDSARTGNGNWQFDTPPSPCVVRSCAGPLLPACQRVQECASLRLPAPHPQSLTGSSPVALINGSQMQAGRRHGRVDSESLPEDTHCQDLKAWRPEVVCILLPLMPTPLLGHGQRQNGRLGPRKSLVSCSRLAPSTWTLPAGLPMQTRRCTGSLDCPQMAFGILRCPTDSCAACDRTPLSATALRPPATIPPLWTETELENFAGDTPPPPLQIPSLHTTPHRT